MMLSENRKDPDFRIALIGNPNVGKSTLFNAYTGLKQHTGNWTGVTVGCTEGIFEHAGKTIQIADLPGTYSLDYLSEEEAQACRYLMSAENDCTVIVCDACCLERNLYLALQILAKTEKKAVICVNLIDEARKKKIEIDLDTLSAKLGVPVVGTSARTREGLGELIDACLGAERTDAPLKDQSPEQLRRIAKECAAHAVSVRTKEPHRSDRRLDRILTGKVTAFPVMFLLLAVVFWLTLFGANQLSEWLSAGLFGVQDILLDLFHRASAPDWLTGALILGMYRTLAWVVSVMLPPMAIFFPLFALLEDVGYLPRIAFNLDRCFHKCRSCGKQALTMCVGTGKSFSGESLRK